MLSSLNGLPSRIKRPETPDCSRQRARPRSLGALATGTSSAAAVVTVRILVVIPLAPSISRSRHEVKRVFADLTTCRASGTDPIVLR